VHKRLEHVTATPVVLAALLKKGWLHSGKLLVSRLFLAGAVGVLTVLLLLFAAMLWQALAPQRAASRFLAGDFNDSAQTYEAYGTAAARYNAANAWYRAGEYERALQLYAALEPQDAVSAARVWFNRGDTLVRLKEYAKARDAFAHSLALHYDEAALDNMLYILRAEEQDHMLTGRQEGKKRAQDQEESGAPEGGKKQKEGGGSEQQSQAQRSQGAGSEGKKAEREPQLEFSNKGGSRLSSKQYELINQRSVHETKPW
jgi:Ca-activated chloride channel family protein